MEMIEKELASRKTDIENEVEKLFTHNMKITDWDVPEADDKKGAILLLKIIEDKLATIKTDIENGKYDYN